MGAQTKAGEKIGAALTTWLQDTRLLSEAAHRLSSDHQKSGRVAFSMDSWPKPQKGDLALRGFEMKPVVLAQRMDELMKTLWRSQFIFLESLWEEYLQDLVLELRLDDARIFEPFCDQKFMAEIVRDVLAGGLGTVDEIKYEAAARFAAGLTRQSWREQWNQLSRLSIGLGKADESLPWFNDLDVYFEMRNCIIHRQSEISPLLHQKTTYYSERKIETIEIWPNHLDFYRWKFIDCVNHIESKIAAKAMAVASKALNATGAGAPAC